MISVSSNDLSSSIILTSALETTIENLAIGYQSLQSQKIGIGIFVGYFCINLLFGPNFALAIITTTARATDNSAVEAPVPNSGIA
jgi:hypothetical protein